MEIKQIHTPLTKEQIESLHAGDQVRITGMIYTARDAAHAKMVQALQTNRPLPMNLQGALIYYAGPTPAKPGQPVGSLGPTTSGRMDAYAPTLLDRGLKGMMGKGPRNKQVRQAIVKNGAVYFAALGGAGALLAKHVKRRIRNCRAKRWRGWKWKISLPLWRWIAGEKTFICKARPAIRRKNSRKANRKRKKRICEICDKKNVLIKGKMVYHR